MALESTYSIIWVNVILLMQLAGAGLWLAGHVGAAAGALVQHMQVDRVLVEHGRQECCRTSLQSRTESSWCCHCSVY